MKKIALLLLTSISLNSCVTYKKVEIPSEKIVYTEILNYNQIELKDYVEQFLLHKKGVNILKYTEYSNIFFVEIEETLNIKEKETKLTNINNIKIQQEVIKYSVRIQVANNKYRIIVDNIKYNPVISKKFYDSYNDAINFSLKKINYELKNYISNNKLNKNW